MPDLIDVIFVPQGAEYQAVNRGLKAVPSANRPVVQTLGIGIDAAQQAAQTWLAKHPENEPKSALLVGLCGGLQPDYGVGDLVLTETCLGWQHDQPDLICDRTFNGTLKTRLPDTPWVTAVTNPTLLHRAVDKQALGSERQADIVEMEGYALLQPLQAAGWSVSMLRVVSDDCQSDVPDLAGAISPDGNLQPLALALRFLQQPLGAAQLVRGSLTGLKQLERAIATLVQS